MWGSLENILNISSHIKLFQHFVTLVQNKVFSVFQVELSSSNQSQNPTWGTDNDMRGVLSQGFPVVLDWHTSEEDAHLNIVQVLAESLVFFWDLESKFPGVAENDGGDLSVDWLDLLKSCEHEDLKIWQSVRRRCYFTWTILGLKCSNKFSEKSKMKKVKISQPTPSPPVIIHHSRPQRIENNSDGAPPVGALSPILPATANQMLIR